MESKKIIEVFVETDEEESYSSSSDDDRAKVATKVSKSKDGSTKEAVHSRCVDIGGNNVPEQTVPQLQGREETTEPERMDLESAKVVNSNTGVTKLGAKKETVVIRHLGDSDGSTSSSDSESSEGSADSPTETGQPQNSAIEGLCDNLCVFVASVVRRKMVERLEEGYEMFSVIHKAIVLNY